MTDDKKYLENLAQINAKFIQSLRTLIEPFVQKLETIHKNNIEFTDEEKSKLQQSINVIKLYSSKEASIVKFFRNRNEKDILDDINHEIAIVMRISEDAKNGKIEQLYRDCEELQMDLLKLEEDILSKKKPAA
jgi:hypothetical protein